MTATPARDTLHRLIHNAVWRSDEECDDQMAGITADEVQVDLLANPALVVAALVESGWRPTADQLRAMGGEESAFDPYGRGRRLWRFPEGVDGD